MAVPFHLVFLLCLTSGLLISGTRSARIERHARDCPLGWTAVDNRCFIARADKKSMIGALVHCLTLGGSLASIHNWRENELAKRLVGDVEAWIGLTDTIKEGTWLWTDGSKVDYTAWKSGQPNDYKGGEDCGSIRHPSGTGWNDDDCHKHLPYICARDR